MMANIAKVIHESRQAEAERQKAEAERKYKAEDNELFEAMRAGRERNRKAAAGVKTIDYKIFD